MSNLDAINKQLAAATEALAKVDADLAWQATGVAADIAGTVDPTPISDLVSAGVSVRNGDLWGAALSTVSMVPYLGDAVAKPVKAVRATKAIAGLTEKATALRKTVIDLTKAKKEAEAAAEITAKEAKIATKADAAKDAATQQEKAAAKKDKDREDCSQTPKNENPTKAPAGVTLEVKEPKILSTPGLSKDERSYLEKELRIKQRAIDRAAARGELVWTPDTSNVRISSLQDEYREAVASRYRNIYGKELDLTRLNADHPVDLVIGGDPTQRLKLLDESINKSVGASLFQAGRKAGLQAGDPISKIIFVPR